MSQVYYVLIFMWLAEAIGFFYCGHAERKDSIYGMFQALWFLGALITSAITIGVLSVPSPEGMTNIWWMPTLHYIGLLVTFCEAIIKSMPVLFEGVGVLATGDKTQISDFIMDLDIFGNQAAARNKADMEEQAKQMEMYREMHGKMIEIGTWEKGGGYEK